MNTGKKITTERLLLLPGQNSRDNAPFLKMLREDGDFRMFCGLDLSEKYLNEFNDYFEGTGNDECIYSIFRKEEPNRFIGYVGFHREYNYELEFYISRQYRNMGYCEEAAKAVIQVLFSEGLSVDGKTIIVDKLYATTIVDNIPTISFLEKIGFKKNIPTDGPVLIMQGFIDDEEDNFMGNCIVEYVLEKNK